MFSESCSTYEDSLCYERGCPIQLPYVQGVDALTPIPGYSRYMVLCRNPLKNDILER